MDKQIYRATYATAHELKWEWGCAIMVTEESNGFAVWDEGVKGTVLVEYLRGMGTRDKAIERGVDEARKLRAAFLADPEKVKQAVYANGL